MWTVIRLHTAKALTAFLVKVMLLWDLETEVSSTLPVKSQDLVLQSLAFFFFCPLRPLWKVNDYSICHKHTWRAGSELPYQESKMRAPRMSSGTLSKDADASSSLTLMSIYAKLLKQYTLLMYTGEMKCLVSVSQYFQSI